MHKSLHWKLTLAFVLVAFASVGLVALSIRITSAHQLETLIIDQQRNSLKDVLARYYETHGSWQGIAQSWEAIHNQVSPTGPDSDDSSSSQSNQTHTNTGDDDLFGLADSQGVVIVPVDQSHPAGSKLPDTILYLSTPIMVSGQQVGTIVDSNRQPSLDPEESLYLQRTNQALLFAVLGALALAFLVGTGLARALVSPLGALKKAAQNITHGHLEQQVAVSSDDELGQLAQAFNRMSQEVARVNQSRRQMTADIAHELNTPLTVISGYMEGLEDGTLRPTQERFLLIRMEIERLQTLVGDLRMLSLADAGELALNPEWTSPQELMHQAAAIFAQSAKQKNIHLAVEVPEDLPVIWVDGARMIQILSNLIGNALRYTPPQGKITLSAKQVDHSVDISVQDTGSGIDPENLPFIFDRFHRADKSRHAEGVQSGLGLAIVKSLAELHGGSTWAESSPGQGSTIHVLMPVHEGQEIKQGIDLD